MQQVVACLISVLVTVSSSDLVSTDRGFRTGFPDVPDFPFGFSFGSLLISRKNLEGCQLSFVQGISSPGSFTVDASLEDGMVAPAGLHLGFSRAEDGCLCSPDDLVLNKGLQQHIEGAIHFTSPPSIGSQGGHGSNYCIEGFTHGKHGINCSERDIKVSSNGTHGFNMVEEPEGNVEEFDPGEKNTALFQQPTTETDKGPQSEGMVLQLTEARESVANVSMNVGFTATGRRVQWNDNHGKELVHVFEYEVSDTEDSEEDDDDTQTCACKIQ